MEALTKFFSYLGDSWTSLFYMTYEHIIMVAVGIGLALIVGVPLGVLCTRNRTMERFILGLANLIQVIPSLAMLAILMLIFGLGFKTIVIGLFLYSLLPIIRNTFVGLREVDAHAIEAGNGMGMTPMQILFKVKIPLSLAFLIAGLRIAVVIAIGVATLAPFIGGEGLGREIVAGINVRDGNKIYGGAIMAAMLAIILDYLLGRLQQKLEVKE